MVERAVYSVAEAAKILGISSAKAYDLINQKQIPFIKIGERKLVPKAILEKYVGRIAEMESSSYSLDEASKVLGVSENTVRKLMSEARLRYYRIGTRVLIPKTAIEDLLNEASA